MLPDSDPPLSIWAEVLRQQTAIAVDGAAGPSRFLLLDIFVRSEGNNKAFDQLSGEVPAL